MQLYACEHVSVAEIVAVAKIGALARARRIVDGRIGDVA